MSEDDAVIPTSVLVAALSATVLVPALVRPWVASDFIDDSRIKTNFNVVERARRPIALNIGYHRFSRRDL